MIDLVSVGRPAGDILSRVVRINLGETEYALPTLTIGGNKRWKAQLDQRLTALIDGLTDGGNDIAAIFGALNQQVDDLLDLLISYDTGGVLPSRHDLEESIHEDELIAAVREVWRAANPLVVMGLEAVATTDEPPTNGSSPPTSLSRPSTTGRRKRSRKG